MKTIYIRTSTKDQTPELQLKDIYQRFPEAKDAFIYQDQQSAWLDHKERGDFNSLRDKMSKRQITHLYVWDLDRIFRNRQNGRGHV